MPIHLILLNGERVKKSAVDIILLCLLLSLLILGFLTSLAHADTGYLQKTGNEYYETARIAYNMEDKVNSTHFYDFSLNGLHGYKQQGQEEVSGYFGYAVQSPINISIPNPQIVDVDWSITMWLYPTSVPAGSGFFFGFSYPHGVQRLYLGGDYKTYFMYNGGGATLASNTTMTLNAWTKITLTYSKANNRLRWWFNATNVGENIGVVEFEDWNSIYYVIGNFGYYQDYFQGKIDEFRFYENLEMTQAQIQSDMATSMAVKLTVNVPSATDVVQLWYNSSVMFQQQTAGSDKKAEFNVFSFSGKTTPYEGIVNVYHIDLQYFGYVNVFYWGDIYAFTVLGVSTIQIEIGLVFATAIFFSVVFFLKPHYVFGFLTWLCWLTVGMMWLLITPIASSPVIAFLFEGVAWVFFLISFIQLIYSIRVKRGSIDEESELD